MTDYPIDIPDSARAVKANYPTKPDQALVRAIREFIKETGTPHLWPGHTHTRPPDGSVIVYCGVYDLPDNCHGEVNRAKWAPCPACHSESAWYFKDGRIAWFPEEHVIRNIGGDCFIKINKEGHQSALREYRAEERRQRDREYLLNNAHLVPVAIRVIERAQATAEDVDTVRMILSQRLTGRIGFNIWNDIRADGVLKRHVKRTVTHVRADGTEEEREEFAFVTHARLDGFQMLDPTAHSFAKRLEKCLATLRKADFGDEPQTRIEALSDLERNKAARSIGKPISEARAIFAELEECRRFLSGESIATLNAWGRHPDSPARLYMRLDGSTLHIGKTEDETTGMSIGAMFFRSLGTLPAFGDLASV